MKIKVYSLLTLDASAIRTVLPDAIAHAPIERECLRSDVREGINVVVIIDGKFYQRAALPPSEVMDALRAGIRVYGASSMGALRAVELEAHGMIGVGRIFRMVRAQRHDFRDDFLGQAFAEESQRPLSLPWVDLRCNLDDLVEAGHLSMKEACVISDAFAELHFSERSWPALRHRLGPKHAALRSLAHRAFSEMGSQKRRDALAALTQARDELAAIAARNHVVASRQNELRLAVVP